MEISDLAQLYGNELHIKQISKWLRGSARAQEIQKRSELDSKDGHVIDEHDQFFRDHKLLLVLFRVLGVMPIQRGEIGRITFGWTSIPMLYAYVFYVVTTVLVVLVGYERFDILLNKSKNLQFPLLSTLIIIISLGCLILAVVFLLTLSALLEGFTLYHTTAYLHIITMINMNCALWYINCRAVGNASTALAESFQNVLVPTASNSKSTKVLFKDVDRNCSAYIIAHYRVLWLSLSDLLQKMGNAYARTYSTYSLFMMANITVAVYGFTSEIVDHGIRFSFKEIGLLVDSTYCLFLLFVFCDCSHQASLNIARRVQVTLLQVNLSQVDPATRKEIDIFLVAIQMNPPKVSLKGYTVVNRELVTASVATIAIYLIVLLQFKISLLNMRG
ncbi:gustatory receptor 2 [Tribolium castaneum]|uniref:Gustatory receptor n=1 Tax=Tribolium castaneum TaxID=7070 RepID=A2AX68_TRICA|nr:gustatory receptor 2 [Tribolium castaneum]CAL23139.2 gustatory receptor candidate 6 [Tribolium castaneum]CAL23159.2 gustatory receptor candidate 26 [Tribolium castaneum]CAL23180.2 gustatory receptor candidate 47 [Tribolium castaneum]|eukprot:NP_001161916.1 gustatory receptor 2 [Tribolium castaneum]